MNMLASEKQLRPLELKTILVPLDASAATEAIVPYVAGMAAHAGAKLVLLTCVPTDMKSGVPEREYLDKVAAPLRRRGLGVATVVRPDNPAEGIIAASQEYEANLIALSVHARPKDGAGLMGSVVHQVLSSRTEPVLVLRPADGREAEKGWTPPSAVVIGLDGSALAATALAPAESLARLFNCEIVLVRAVLPPDPLGGAARYYGAVEDFAERHLAGVAESLRQHGHKVSTRTGHRVADQEILSAAAAWPGSIVVLSTRGLTGRTNLVLGSVTERVIRAQKHPVLAIPAARLR